MTYGIQLLNPAGRLQLSSDLVTPWFVGTCSYTRAPSGVAGYDKLTISRPANSLLGISPLILAVRVNGVSSGLYGQLSIKSYIGGSASSQVAYISSGVTSITVLAFAMRAESGVNCMPSATLGNAGMQLFNAAGKKMYDSTYKHMHIHESTTITGSTSIDTWTSAATFFSPFGAVILPNWGRITAQKISEGNVLFNLYQAVFEFYLGAGPSSLSVSERLVETWNEEAYPPSNLQYIDLLGNRSNQPLHRLVSYNYAA